MTKIFLILLFLSTSSFAQILGSDSEAGQTRLMVADGPIIFDSQVWTEKQVSFPATQPFIILSAFDTCNGRDLVPRFLDTNSGTQNGLFLSSRTFKCVGGDLDDWKRLLKQQCFNVKETEHQALFRYCAHLENKLGPSFIKCNGACEKVQDLLLAQ